MSPGEVLVEELGRHIRELEEYLEFLKQRNAKICAANGSLITENKRLNDRLSSSTLVELGDLLNYLRPEVGLLLEPGDPGICNEWYAVIAEEVELELWSEAYQGPPRRTLQGAVNALIEELRKERDL